MGALAVSASDYVKELAPPDVDDAGAPGLGPEPAPAHHQVLVEAQRRHLRDPPGVRVQQSPAPTLHRKVDGVPPTAQLRGRVLERAAPPRLACSPPRRARRQQRPRRRDLAGRPSDSARPTAPPRAAPPALVPHQAAGLPNAGRSTSTTARSPSDHNENPPQPPHGGLAARQRTCTRNGPPPSSPTLSTSTSPSPTNSSHMRVGSYSTGILQSFGGLLNADSGGSLAFNRGPSRSSLRPQTRRAPIPRPTR